MSNENAGQNASNNICFSKKAKILFIIIAFGLTVALSACGVFEQSIKPVWPLLWLVIGLDAISIGCIVGRISFPTFGCDRHELGFACRSVFPGGIHAASFYHVFDLPYLYACHEDIRE